MSTAPPITSTIPKEAVKRERFNLGVIFLDAIGWPLGMSFISATTIIPLFLNELGAPNIAVGMVSAIASFGALMPQLLAASYIQSLPLKKYYVWWVGLAERIPFLVLVPLTLWWGQSHPYWLILAFFCCWSINAIGMGFNIPCYLTLFAKIIKVATRGRLMGASGIVGSLLGVVGAGATAVILATVTFPLNFALLFLIGFVLLTVTLIGFPFIHEEYEHEAPTVEPVRQFLRQAPQRLRSNPGLTWYTVAQMVMGFSWMASAFYTVYALKQIHVTAGDVAGFTGITMATGIVANALWGVLADRLGHKLVVECNALCTILSLIAILAWPALPGIWLAFILNSFAAAALGVSSSNIILEFSSAKDLPIYLALNGMLSSPARFIAPLLGGWLADGLHSYTLVFVLSLVTGLLSLAILRLKVPEPRNTLPV